MIRLAPWLLIAGCSAEPGLVLTLALAPNDAAQEVVVRFTATSSDSTACFPARLVVPARCLPYALAVSPGERYADSFVVQAEALALGEIVASREKIIPFAAGERLEDTLVLDPECTARCGTDARCDGDACVPSADATSILDGEAATLDDVPCLPAAPEDFCP